MAKRSTNFNPRRPKITGRDLLNLAEWLGMTDEEIKAMAERHAKRLTDAELDTAAYAAEQRHERDR